jgi:hypothetical protein
MDTAPPPLSHFFNLLAGELSRFRSAKRSAFVQEILIPPFPSRLKWEHGANEIFHALTFADMGKRDQVVQYCRGGFGARGAPWGINERDATQFGSESDWYPNLEALIADWGIKE